MVESADEPVLRRRYPSREPCVSGQGGGGRKEVFIRYSRRVFTSRNEKRNRREWEDRELDTLMYFQPKKSPNTNCLCWTKRPSHNSLDFLPGTKPAQPSMASQQPPPLDAPFFGPLIHLPSRLCNALIHPYPPNPTSFH